MNSDQQDATREEPMDATDAAVTNRATDVGFWKEMWRQVRLVWYLIRDPEVPLYLKVLPLVAVIYVLIPTDLIPDIIPGLGQLDDITALILGGKVFIELAPQHVISRYIQSIREGAATIQRDDASDELDGDVSGSVGDSIIIEGEFEAVDDEEDQAV